MKRRSKVKKILQSEKGGIGTIIATVVTIILTLGLIAYAVLGQVAGAKDVGDKGQIEQQKVLQLIQDQDTVTGNTVKSYISQAIVTNSILKVAYTNINTGTATIESRGSMPTDIKDSAIYSITKQYNANGELILVTCVQKDLSKK
ncbi:MAG: hypothetical protein K0R31_208 [Clostridiales bacterium]|jgi:hypothetical protein|nr:hypothetical protein [Clostridiales bacterium]